MIAYQNHRKIAYRGCLLLGLFLLGTAGFSCAGSKESIVTVGGDKKLSAEEIDGNPLALLPGGAVGHARMDVDAFMKTPAGPQTTAMVENVFPITPEMNFDAKKDVTRIYAAFYSMQSADVAIIAQGNFDAAGIAAAVKKGAKTKAGYPIVEKEYANNKLYVSGDIGFSVLTNHTALAGNSAGMRRALDRIRLGTIRREMPDWVVDVLSKKEAELAMVSDFESQPLTASIVNQVPFLNELKNARILGNFQPPGMHFAGSFSYKSATSAQTAASSLQNINEILKPFQFVQSMFGGSPAIQSLQANAVGNDTQVTMVIDGQSISSLISMLGSLSSVGQPSPPPAVAPAPTTPMPVSP
jgi:hypothetical protein